MVITIRAARVSVTPTHTVANRMAVARVTSWIARVVKRRTQVSATKDAKLVIRVLDPFAGTLTIL